MRVKRKSTIRVNSVVILAPVFAQLIRISDWDQNSRVRLVFGLSERLIQKVKSPTVLDAYNMTFIIHNSHLPTWLLSSSSSSLSSHLISSASRILHPTCHITHHFADKSFQASDCTGTDNQTTTKNKTTHLSKTQKNNQQQSATAKTNTKLQNPGLVTFRNTSGEEIKRAYSYNPIAYTGPSQICYYTVSPKKWPNLYSL